MNGLVIKNTGSWYLVKPDGDDNAPLLRCKVKGNFRLRGIRTTNPVAVGDRVTVVPGDGDTGFITAIAPRKNYIIRRASNLSKESHIIGANIDMAMLVVSLVHPATSTTFIDRFLATAEAYRVPVTLVINKVDLLSGVPEAEAYLAELCDLYRSLGYPVIEVSARTGEGIDLLREALSGNVTLLSGNSGVGKSTIVNDLIPGLGVKTAEVSAIHDTGMHTTTFSEMYELPGEAGGWIIDTPGVKGFGTVDFDRDEVSHFFREIFRESACCRYSNCTHTHEPGCAVREALDRGEIAPSRYASYLSILEDTTGQEKYRKPF